MIYIVTRHQSTVNWIKAKLNGKGVRDVFVAGHLSDQMILQMKKGDAVYGILPIHLIRRLLRKGVDYSFILSPHR